MDNQLSHIRPFHRWWTYQNPPLSTGIPQWTTTTNIRQQTQECPTIQVLPVTRSTTATRANRKIPTPNLQVQANIRPANPMDHHQNEPLQGHGPKWTLKCSTNSLCRSANSPSRMPLPCNIPSQSFSATMENNIHSSTTETKQTRLHGSQSIQANHTYGDAS